MSEQDIFEELRIRFVKVQRMRIEMKVYTTEHWLWKAIGMETVKEAIRFDLIEKFNLGKQPPYMGEYLEYGALDVMTELCLKAGEYARNLPISENDLKSTAFNIFELENKFWVSMGKDSPPPSPLKGVFGESLVKAPPVPFRSFRSFTPPTAPHVPIPIPQPPGKWRRLKRKLRRVVFGRWRKRNIGSSERVDYSWQNADGTSF